MLIYGVFIYIPFYRGYSSICSTIVLDYGATKINKNIFESFKKKYLQSFSSML